MTEMRITFEGYWQCRQATDPDPSDEPRGVSGYTFAVGYENDFDQVIYLQRDQIPEVDFREPYRNNFGVYVTGATIMGATDESEALRLSAIRGAKVYLRPSENNPDRLPKFELRNEIIFHELQGIIMPICPFNIEVAGDGWKLQREDPLDINDPLLEIWQMVEGYERRSPRNFYVTSDEAIRAIGIVPTPDYATAFSDYFQRRKQWLTLRWAEVTDPIESEALKTRIWAIDFFSQDQRMESRLGLQAVWDFEIRGKTAEVTGASDYFGRTIDTDSYWRVHFWMGGFDGDLMQGYMRGYLQVPFATEDK